VRGLFVRATLGTLTGSKIFRLIVPCLTFFIRLRAGEVSSGSWACVGLGDLTVCRIFSPAIFLLLEELTV